VDWQALWLSLRLGALTVLVLIPVAIFVGRWLAVTRVRGRPLIEAALALPLVLPPTVIGFYLLVAFSPRSWFGDLWRQIFGGTLVFSFEGLLIASVLINIPFAVQPAQRLSRRSGRTCAKRRRAAACRGGAHCSAWNCRSPGPAFSPAWC
jgi:molybdate transport system permease protein